MPFVPVQLETAQEMSSERGSTSCIPKPFPGQRPGPNMAVEKLARLSRV